MINGTEEALVVKLYLRVKCFKNPLYEYEQSKDVHSYLFIYDSLASVIRQEKQMNCIFTDKQKRVIYNDIIMEKIQKIYK